EMRKYGIQTIFFTGTLEMSENGQTFEARGAVSRDGKRIWVKADDTNFTVRQIADHEKFHALVKRSNASANMQSESLLEKVRQEVLSKNGDAELQEMVNAYVDEYGFTDVSEEYILEEILADAYAGMDIFEDRYLFEGATKFTDVVREETDKNNFESTEELSDDTGQERFSLRAFEDGRRYVDVETDQAQFDNLNDKEKTKLAIKIIKSKYKGRVIGIDNRIFVNGRSAAEYGHPAKNINGEIRNAKMRASTELDNIVDAGTNFRTAPDGADGHIHANAVGDFEYFDVLFKVGNEYYQGVLNIENVTQDISSSYGKNPKSTFLRNASMNSISDSSEKINTSDEKFSRTGQEKASRRSKYNEFESLAMQWRYNAATEIGDLKIICKRANDFHLLKATDSGYIEIAKGKSYKEMKTAYESIYGGKIGGFNESLKVLKNTKRGDFRNLLVDGNRGYVDGYGDWNRESRSGYDQQGGSQLSWENISEISSGDKYSRRAVNSLQEQIDALMSE
ncbi:MAG: hypothetical protein IJ736_01405, partial [Firmicutes bacterium]|nr:hypothetical protein [Bacillota bacterium]